MSLVRAWTRQVSGASAAALLVPGAIFVSLLLLALAGGFGHLSGLGQAFAGPSAPGGARAANAVSGAGKNGGAAAPLLPVFTAARGPKLVAVNPAAAHGGRSVAVGRNGGPGSPGGSRTATNPTAPATPTAPAPAPVSQPISPTPPGSPGSGQPRPPTLVDQVVSLGTSITSKIPGPVGALATGVLGDVGQTLDNALPGNARSSPTQLGGNVGSTVSGLGSGLGRVVPGLHLP